MQSKNGTQELTPTFRVSINGKDLAKVNKQAETDLFMVSVYEDVTAPSMFTLTLNNEDMDKLTVTWSDDDLFAEGARIAIEMGYVGSLRKLIDGEVTGLEPDFRAGETPRLHVRGYDLRHCLMRERKTRSFVLLTDSAIAEQVVDTTFKKRKFEETGITHDYVLQHNQTDWEFLQVLARRNGYEVMVEDDTFLFRPHNFDEGAALELSEKDLLEFYPRTSTMNQVGQVIVRGWDPANAKPFTSTWNAGDEVAVMDGTTGPALAKALYRQSVMASVQAPVLSQAEGDRLAQSRLDEMALSFVTAEGTCRGRTDLRAGRLVNIGGLGKRFSGKYYVTSATHTFSPSRGYRTYFKVTDMMALDVLRDMTGGAAKDSRFYGVVIGIVTNNHDPEGLGRVKVKLPWLADGQESHWARMVSPMAGKGRGIYTLPEVNDEVLVGFLHGDARFAYVLGGLWNGRDQPPESNSDGKNNVRVIRSRSGHTIRLDDSGGAEKIEIRDGSGKTSILLDTASNSIVVEADKDITIKSIGGQLSLDAETIRIEAKTGLTIKGEPINLN